MAKSKISVPSSADDAVDDPVLNKLYEKMARAKWRFYALSAKIQERERKTYAVSDKLLAQRERLIDHMLL